MAAQHHEEGYPSRNSVISPSETGLFPEIATLLSGVRAGVEVDPARFSFRRFVRWRRSLYSSERIVRLANYILSQAIDLGASEIHLEPLQRNQLIRLRMDGLLYEGVPLPKHLQLPLISRYKTMGSMNPWEHRTPQEGRIQISHNDRHYDIHVSCLPSQYGERVAMRIVSSTGMRRRLSQIGFAPAMQAQLEDLMAPCQGMLLVTGPSGSVQTVYSMLTYLNSVTRNILTIEDPVETVLPGITQVHVDEKNGVSLASGLRAILRQSPDVVMVSELRERETVRVAMETALSGRLVLSTMSAPDGPSALLRLIHLSIDPSQLPQAVVGVLAQRLARRICTACRESYTVAGSDLRHLGFPQQDSEQEEITLYRGRGCDQCRGSGYRGQIGIYELMEVSAPVAAAVATGSSLAEIRTAARLAGMQEMWEDGMRKILQGHTAPEEVRRVAFTPHTALYNNGYRIFRSA